MRDIWGPRARVRGHCPHRRLLLATVRRRLQRVLGDRGNRHMYLEIRPANFSPWLQRQCSTPVCGCLMILWHWWRAPCTRPGRCDSSMSSCAAATLGCIGTHFLRVRARRGADPAPAPQTCCHSPSSCGCSCPPGGDVHLPVVRERMLCTPCCAVLLRVGGERARHSEGGPCMAMVVQIAANLKASFLQDHKPYAGRRGHSWNIAYRSTEDPPSHTLPIA